MFVPNFKILSQVVSEKSLTEKKFTDRQTDRQTNIRTEKAKTIYSLYTSYTGGIINTQYNLSYLMFVPNFKILSQVVSEKSLTEKKVYRQTDRQTNIRREKAKTIYPLYTSYTRGINIGLHYVS